MIRPVKPTDVKVLTKIYNEYILHTAISFETEALTEEEMRSRVIEISTHFPYFVYEANGEVQGYCYAHLWKTRSAYCKTLETTIYLAAEHCHEGIGKQLMSALIEACREKGYSVLIACITGNNMHSRRFHEELGFKQVSLFEKVGEKFGECLDVVDYELLLK